MKMENILKILGNAALFGGIALVVYFAYKKYKEASDMVVDYKGKIDMGLSEVTDFLKNKNQEYEERIKEKKEKVMNKS